MKLEGAADSHYSKRRLIVHQTLRDTSEAHNKQDIL